MKKMNFINGFLLVLIICVSLIGIGGVVYQKVVLDKKTESTNDTSRSTDTDTDVVDNDDGTHTHTYTDENGKTVTETHSNDEHESENSEDDEKKIQKIIK